MELTQERVTVPERLLRPYMEWCHGKRDSPHQYDFYRCVGCRRVVNWKRIHRGGCDCDTGNKLKPAKLTLWEKTKILVLPWLV